VVTLAVADTKRRSQKATRASATPAQAPFTGRTPRVTPITTAEYPLPARRPANSELDCSLFARIFGIRARPWTEETDRITRVLVEAQVGTTQHVA